MKPFLLLCADPPAPHVAAALDCGMRVVAVGTTQAALAPVMTAFERPFRSRELIPIDLETLERSGLRAALTAERKMPSRELLIRGAVGYAGIPDAAILYTDADLIHLAEAARRANRRPRCIGLRDGKVSQTEILFDLGYRDIVLRRASGQGCHILATNEDLSGEAMVRTDPPALRGLLLRLLEADPANLAA
jgi:hypothetical protein